LLGENGKQGGDYGGSSSHGFDGVCCGGYAQGNRFTFVKFLGILIVIHYNQNYKR
jgi:hypothetical protein